jgi:hypothetical protein
VITVHQLQSNIATAFHGTFSHDKGAYFTWSLSLHCCKVHSCLAAKQCQTHAGAKPNEQISDIAIKYSSCQTGLAIAFNVDRPLWSVGHCGWLLAADLFIVVNWDDQSDCALDWLFSFLNPAIVIVVKPECHVNHAITFHCCHCFYSLIALSSAPPMSSPEVHFTHISKCNKK